MLGKKQNGRERSGNVVLCWRKSRVLYIGMYYFIYSVGFARNEMEKIAGYIADVIGDFDGNKERITEEVISLCEKFPIYNK